LKTLIAILGNEPIGLESVTETGLPYILCSTELVGAHNTLVCEEETQIESCIKYAVSNGFTSIYFMNPKTTINKIPLETENNGYYSDYTVSSNIQLHDKRLEYLASITDARVNIGKNLFFKISPIKNCKSLEDIVYKNNLIFSHVPESLYSYCEE